MNWSSFCGQMVQAVGKLYVCGIWKDSLPMGHRSPCFGWADLRLVQRANPPWWKGRETNTEQAQLLSHLLTALYFFFLYPLISTLHTQPCILSLKTQNSHHWWLFYGFSQGSQQDYRISGIPIPQERRPGKQRLTLTGCSCTQHVCFKN